MKALIDDIRACRLCADRFAKTQTQHSPRPVVWAAPEARVLIAGQAPGARVHESGRPFTDPSGDRLRAWMGLDEDTFYDRSRIAIVPMAFCFPGYNAKGSDLPPPPLCTRTWHTRVMAALTQVRLHILVGSYAFKWHLGVRARVDDTVRDWAAHAPQTFVLPHPSWRNTAWLKRNPFFEAEVVPALQSQITKVLHDG